jgi:hypothetical protein
MSAKHTPGPWLFETFDDGDSSVGKPPSGDLIYHETMGHKIPICSVEEPCVGSFNFPENVISSGLASANRRLILAAPDLLSALDSAPVIRLGETLEEFRVRYSRWHREVKVPAVNKATPPDHESGVAP